MSREEEISGPVRRLRNPLPAARRPTHHPTNQVADQPEDQPTNMTNNHDFEQPKIELEDVFNLTFSLDAFSKERLGSFFSFFQKKLNSLPPPAPVFTPATDSLENPTLLSFYQTDEKEIMSLRNASVFDVNSHQTVLCHSFLLTGTTVKCLFSDKGILLQCFEQTDRVIQPGLAILGSLSFPPRSAEERLFLKEFLAQSEVALRCFPGNLTLRGGHGREYGLTNLGSFFSFLPFTESDFFLNKFREIDLYNGGPVKETLEKLLHEVSQRQQISTSLVCPDRLAKDKSVDTFLREIQSRQFQQPPSAAVIVDLVINLFRRVNLHAQSFEITSALAQAEPVRDEIVARVGPQLRVISSISALLSDIGQTEALPEDDLSCLNDPEFMRTYFAGLPPSAPPAPQRAALPLPGPALLQARPGPAAALPAAATPGRNVSFSLDHGENDFVESLSSGLAELGVQPPFAPTTNPPFTPTTESTTTHPTRPLPDLPSSLSHTAPLPTDKLLVERDLPGTLPVAEDGMTLRSSKTLRSPAQIQALARPSFSDRTHSDAYDSIGEFD